MSLCVQLLESYMSFICISFLSWYYFNLVTARQTSLLVPLLFWYLLRRYARNVRNYDLKCSWSPVPYQRWKTKYKILFKSVNIGSLFPFCSSKAVCDHCYETRIGLISNSLLVLLVHSWWMIEFQSISNPLMAFVSLASAGGWAQNEKIRIQPWIYFKSIKHDMREVGTRKIWF